MPKDPAAPEDALVTQHVEARRDMLLEARAAWQKVLAGMQRFGMESDAIDKVDEFFARLTDDMICQFWGNTLAAQAADGVEEALGKLRGLTRPQVDPKDCALCRRLGPEHAGRHETGPDAL